MNVAEGLGKIAMIAEAALAPRPSVLRDHVETTVTYLVDTSIKPVSYNPRPGTGVPRRVGNYASFPVIVRDARPIAGDLSLDREAFVLARHDTAVRDFYDADEVRRVYYPEIERLVAEQTGAKKVVVFDHTIRVAEKAIERG